MVVVFSFSNFDRSRLTSRNLNAVKRLIYEDELGDAVCSFNSMIKIIFQRNYKYLSFFISANYGIDLQSKYIIVWQSQTYEANF